MAAAYHCAQPFKGVLVLLAYSLATANQSDEGKPAFDLLSDVSLDQIGCIGIDTAMPTVHDLAIASPAVRCVLA